MRKALCTMGAAILLFATCHGAEVQRTEAIESQIRQSVDYVWGEAVRLDSLEANDAAVSVLMEKLWTERMQALGRPPAGNNSLSDPMRHAAHVYAESRFKNLHRRMSRHGDSLAVLVYFNRSELPALSDSLVQEVVAEVSTGRTAERADDFAGAMMHCYLGYLLSRSPWITLRPDSTGKETIDPSSYVRKVLERLVRRIVIHADSVTHHGDYISVHLNFSFHALPINGLTFSYSDGPQTGEGRSFAGEDYVDLKHLHPANRYMRLPIHVIYPDSPWLDPGASYQKLFRLDTVRVEVPVALTFPWCAGTAEDSVRIFRMIEAADADTLDRPSAPGLPAEIKHLSEISGSRDFENLARYAAQQGNLAILASMADVRTATKPVWVAVLNNERVIAFYEYDGVQYKDVHSGELQDNLDSSQPNCRFLWLTYTSHK